MQHSDNRPGIAGQRAKRISLWPWGMALAMFLVILLGFMLPHTGEHKRTPDSTNQLNARAGNSPFAKKPPLSALAVSRGHRGDVEAVAKQIVAAKLKTFAISRRRQAHALAQRHGVPVPNRVDKFFDAVESGNWDEIKARFRDIKPVDRSTATKLQAPDVQAMWPAILDAFGVAEEVHRWPAQQLLDYGNTVMNSLSPDMVYVGGTDVGRFVPELMNESSGDTPHIMLTQNALADPGYLDYLKLQYGDKIAPLTTDDLDRATQNYADDYQKRLAHDEQFPDEPAQVLPGELDGVKIGSDGKPQVNGLTPVMAVNEILLTTLMNQNPQLSYALQESFALKSTYADAVPLGSIMELRAPDGQNAFTPDVATQTLNYWNATTRQLLSDPDGAGSDIALKAYADDEAAAANLLAAHNFNAEAEQIYRSAVQLSSSSSWVALDYANFLMGQNRTLEAISVATAGAQADPNNQQLQMFLNQAKGSKAP